MRGRSHVVLGALGWLAAAPPVADRVGVEMPPATLALSTVACAGMALLPDLDHPQGTIAQSLGPVTRAPARVLSRLLGGHRNASHGLLFAGVAAAVTQLLHTLVGREAMAALLFCAVAFGLRALRPPHGRARVGGTLLIAGQAAAVAAVGWWQVPGDWPWLPYAVGAGCLLHLLGDLLTNAGVPLFHPFRRRFSVPLLGFPGDGDERLLVSLMTGTLAWLAVRTF